WVVIGRAPVAQAPTLWRKRDENIAEPGSAERERAIAAIGVVFGRAPRGFDAARNLAGERSEMAPVVLQRHPAAACARFERFEQGGRATRRIGAGVTRFGEVGEERDHALRHVEADGVARAAAR